MKDFKIVNRGGALVIDSREIAEMTEKEHKNLLRDIDQYLEYLENSKLSNGRNIDLKQFFIPSEYESGIPPRKYRHYLVTKKGCDMIANKMTGEKGVLFTANYIDKFYEMEEAIKTKFAVPSTFVEALRLAADKVEENERLKEEKNLLMIETNKQKEKIEQSKPKVIFADSVVSSNDTILIRDLAKILKQNGVNIGEIRLYEWLRNNEYLCKFGDSYNKPTQKSMNLGLFSIVERTINTPVGAKVTQTTKVTGKGQVYFVNKFLGANEIKRNQA